MARKERERYVERSRPHRREPGKSGGGSSGGQAPRTQDSPWRNPVVLVAIGALVLAGSLALGVFAGRRPASDTAMSPTPVVELPTPALVTPLAEGETAPTPAMLSKPSFAAPEDQGLDPSTQSYFATIQTPKGDIVLELWPELAPEHVNSFVFLAREGFYDGLTFHRVEPGFVIQGGDPDGNGQGGPGFSLPAEFNTDNPVPHRRGTLAMARTNDPNSAGSQFYIVLEDGPTATSLDGQYTVFGHVISGMNVVSQIARGDLMTQVRIEEKAASESVVRPDAIRAGELPEND